MTTGSSARQPQDAAFTDDWQTLSDELLQGLVHALNNRVAALSALVELARLGDEEEDPLSALPSEIAQLHQVNGLFALLPARRSDAEALDPSVAMEDALHLHEHHPRLRGERCVVTYEGTATAVRVPRWAFVRALVMLIHAAKRAGESVQGRGCAPVRVRSDAAALGVHVETSVEPSADLVALAARCGGAITQEGGELTLRLPTLLELRRREQEARGRDAPAG
jgi:hypothetical protein